MFFSGRRNARAFDNSACGGVIWEHNDNEFHYNDYHKYFRRVAPIAISLEKITTHANAVDILYQKQLKEEGKSVFEINDFVLFLKQKSLFYSYSQQLSILIDNYYINGTAYVIVRGNIDREPLDWYVADYNNVKMEDDTRSHSQHSGDYNKSDFHITDPSKRMIKYKNIIFIYDFKLGIWTNEARDFQLIIMSRVGFSTTEDYFYGESILSSIGSETCQNYLINKHNNSLLNNGAKISGIFTAEQLSVQDQQNIENRVKKEYTGTSKAGKTMILAGRGLKFQQLSMTTSDMDFDTLKKTADVTIFNTFGIPLPLVNVESQKFSNYSSSQAVFYTDTVLPLLSDVFGFFTESLNFRFKLSGRLVSDEENIPSLKSIKIQSVNELSAAGILTINELRNRLGFPDVEGGDAIYRSSTDVPVAFDISEGAEGSFQDDDEDS